MVKLWIRQETNRIEPFWGKSNFIIFFYHFLLPRQKTSRIESFYHHPSYSFIGSVETTTTALINKPVSPLVMPDPQLNPVVSCWVYSWLLSLFMGSWLTELKKSVCPCFGSVSRPQLVMLMISGISEKKSIVVSIFESDGLYLVPIFEKSGLFLVSNRDFLL